MSKQNYNKMFDADSVEHVEDVVEEVAEMAKVEEVAEPELEPEEYQMGNVVNCVKLNIRAASDPHAEIVKVVDKGTEVMIYLDESTGDFYKVCTESGIEGFCMKQFIKIQ